MENKTEQNIIIKLLYKMPSLMFGLFLYGLAIDLGLYSRLGMSPWDIFHMGIVNHTSFSLGEISIMAGFVIILISMLLGVIPGLGTVFNMVFIGLFIDLINNTGILRTPDTLIFKILMLLSALATMAAATYFYLKVELGAGPRDGLMEGLIIKTGKPVWIIRGSIEVTVLIIGFIMGGPVGVGTLMFAFGIGPCVQLAFKIGKYDSKEAQHMTFVDLYKSIKPAKQSEQ
ncbi:MAG: membrane protein [Eubacteriales bacterium]|nr:membrane protein [Eubacteriales bacterium]MDD4566254.1 membrane protein [Eubacteriales bacterium]